MQKFIRGQRVRIIQLLDSRGMEKYPELGQHVSKRGMIIGGYWMYNRLPRIFRDQYLYQVAIEDERQRVTAPEDALKAEIEISSMVY